MDFPLQLIPTRDSRNTEIGRPEGSNLEFTYGDTELKNDLYLLLKSPLGTFLQDINLGTVAVPHMLDELYLQSAVQRCVEQIRGLSCEGVTVRNGRLYVRVSYRGRIQDFSFSIQSF